MKRVVIAHIALLALSVGFLRSTANVADGDADDKAIRDLTQRFYAAFAAKDLDAFMALWSENSPGYEARKKDTAGLYDETGPIQVKSFAVVRVRRDGDAASVRIRLELIGGDAKTGKPHPALGRLDGVLDLAREAGGWKFMRSEPSDQRLMERLADAESKAEALRLLDDDSDLVGPDFMEMMRNEGYRLAGQGQFDRAALLLDMAVRLAEGLGDGHALAGCHLYRGQFLESRSRHGPALASYHKALELFREANDREGEGAALCDIGIAYESTGLYAEALQQYQDCLKIKRDLGDRAGEAKILNNIGNAYRATARYTEALSQLQESLEIIRDLKDREEEAGTLSNIGNVYASTGRYPEALQRYQDCLKIDRDFGNCDGEAATLGNIGNVYTATARYGDALRQHQETLRIYQDRKDQAGEAKALNNIGNVYASTGRYPEALQEYLESLNIKRDLGDHAGAARTLNNIGVVNENTLHYPEALQCFQGCLTMERDMGDRAGEANTQICIGNVYGETGRKAEALQHYQDSLKIAHDLGDRAREAYALNNIGYIYYLSIRYEEALRQYQASLKISQELRDGAGEARTLANVGQVYQTQKDWEQAVQAYRAAVHATERLRDNTREPSLQSSLLAQKTGPLFRLAECLLELRQPSDALAAAEGMKARGLVDILRDGKADLRRGMTDDERKQEQKLEEHLTALSVQLEGMRNRKADADRQTELIDDLDKARLSLEAFHRDLYLHRPELQTRRAEFTPASLQDLGGAFFAGRSRLVVLSYLVGEKETLLFVLTAPNKHGGPARLTVHRIDVESKELTEAEQAFREACSDPAKSEPDAADLYRWLVAPAADELAGAKQLVIVPDSALHTLPFQALKDAEGKYLIERFAVSYAPSVTALVKMEALGEQRRKEYAGRPPTLLALGVSEFGRRERALPAAEKEARAVADAFGDGAKLLPGKEATRANLEASWSGRRFLHFATHGRLNSDDPLYSSLVLSSAGAGDEGALYARDLLDAEIPAELAVMSACQTGLGKHVSGEGLQGLSWAWFTAGVPSTVASQWSVGDDSTARLMKVFYACLQAGDSKTEALRQAELALLKDDATPHPFYWAPFVLVGDDR